MKKFFPLILVAVIMLFSPLMFACNNDNEDIIGSWYVTGYEGSYLNSNNEQETKYYSSDEVDDLVYDETISPSDMTNEQLYVFIIVNMNNTLAESAFVIKSDNTYEISSTIGEWNRDGDKIILQDSQSTTETGFLFDKESNKLILALQDFDDMDIEVYFEK